MQRQPDAATLRKLRSQRFHRGFLYFDSAMFMITFVLSLVMLGQPCPLTFYCFFAIYYFGQSIQHYLCLHMPKMDIVRYDKRIKRYMMMISAI